jgi:tryptophan 7-halogenase
MVERVLVLGAGTAGLLSAIALKTKIPRLRVTLLGTDEPAASASVEGTAPHFRELVHRYLGIGLPEFYREVAPTPKLGMRYIWGPRPSFNLPYGSHVLAQPEGFARPLGYYCDEDMENLCPASSLMSACRAFPVAENGSLVIVEDMAYHLDAERLVSFLMRHATKLGVECRSEKIREVKQGAEGVAGLVTESRITHQADIYVDSSGPRSLLVGHSLGEPLLSYRSSLFCDRTLTGTRLRDADEPIRPYTTAEAMNAGWCWQLDLEDRIALGYVYASDFLSDQEAEKEFLAKNPRGRTTGVLTFESGRRRNAWTQNVVGVGEAAGFIEPLAAASLQMISHDVSRLTEILLDAKLSPGPAARAYNVRSATSWDAIRDFLAVHYRFNTRLDTPFWRACRADVDLGGASELVAYYQREGPDGRGAHLVPPSHSWLGFTADAFYTLLLGQRVPYRKTYEPSDDELRELAMIRLENRALALNSFEPGRALRLFRDSGSAMRQGSGLQG